MHQGGLELPTSLRGQIVTTARSAWPFEMVGLLGGYHAADRLAVQQFVHLPLATCTRDAFSVPAPMFAAGEAELRRRGSQWLGFVHSHPNGQATPSADDRRSLWRDCLQMIVAVDDHGRAQFAAFWPHGEEFVRVPDAPLPEASLLQSTAQVTGR